MAARCSVIPPRAGSRTGGDEKHLLSHQPAEPGVHSWAEEQRNPAVKSKGKFLITRTGLGVRCKPSPAAQPHQLSELKIK